MEKTPFNIGIKDRSNVTSTLGTSKFSNNTKNSFKNDVDRRSILSFVKVPANKGRVAARKRSRPRDSKPRKSEQQQKTCPTTACHHKMEAFYCLYSSENPRTWCQHKGSSCTGWTTDLTQCNGLCFFEFWCIHDAVTLYNRELLNWTFGSLYFNGFMDSHIPGLKWIHYFTNRQTLTQFLSATSAVVLIIARCP